MSAVVLAFWTALAGEAVGATLVGAEIPRRVAVLYVLTAAASELACGAGHACNRTFLLAPAVIDLALLGGLILLMVREPRLWLIMSVALQLLTILAYVAQLTASLAPIAIFMTRVASSWPALILLGWGIATHARRAGRC